MDSTPLLWSLLDAAGAAARWRDVRMPRTGDRPAGSVLRTLLRHGSGRLECRDGLCFPAGNAPGIVRLVRNLDGELDVVHELAPRAGRAVDALRVLHSCTCEATGSGGGLSHHVPA